MWFDAYGFFLTKNTFSRRIDKSYMYTLTEFSYTNIERIFSYGENSTFPVDSRTTGNTLHIEMLLLQI